MRKKKNPAKITVEYEPDLELAATVDKVVFRVRVLASIVLALGFLGGIAIARVGVNQTWEAWQSENWRQVPGTVSESDMTFSSQSHSTDNRDGNVVRDRREVSKDVWSPKLTYEFELDGQKYEGHRIAVADIPLEKQSDATKALNRYAVGNGVVVHIHPVDPTLSILEPGITFGAVGPLIIGTVVCAIMGCFEWFVLSKMLVTLVDGLHKPGGIYTVGTDGRLQASNRKKKG